MLATFIQDEKALVRKPERKGIHGRREHRWEDKNKTNFQEIGQETVLD
jgi:hypothetical protein